MELEVPFDEGGLTVAVDTETNGVGLPDDGVRVAVVSLAWDDQVRAFPFDQGVRDKLGTDGRLDLDYSEGDPNLSFDDWSDLLDWLSRQELVFHNAKYDLHALAAGTRHWLGVNLEGAFMWDTMVAERNLDPTSEVGLAKVARRRFGVDDQKHDLDVALKKYKLKRYDLLPWEAIEAYAAQDAAVTLKLYHDQHARFAAGEGQPQWLDPEFKLLHVLYRMERRGMAFDVETCVEAAEEVRRRIAVLKGQFPFRATLNGAKEYFFRIKGVLPYKTTDKGAPQLDDEVLAKMVNDEIEWAQEYSDLTKLEKALSMWYQGYAEKCGPDGRLRTSFKQVSVKSGRMSVERVQLQAIPKKDKNLEGVTPVRSMFHAKPGHELWNLDLGQAELRVATKIAKCTKMQGMLDDGADIHGITCQEVLGVSPDADDWKVQRDIAKRLTFGGIFQIGGKKFKETLSKLAGIEITLAEAEAHVRRWREAYPEFGVMYRKAEKVFRTRGYVKLIGGAYSFKGPLDYPNTGWNRVVQGSLALFNKLWLIDVEETAPPDSLVLSVHDSVVLELPTDAEPPIQIANWLAERGAGMATRHFKTKMTVDVGLWYQGEK